MKQHVVTVTARPAAAPERVVDPEKAQEIARTITQKLHRIQKNILELKQVKFVPTFGVFPAVSFLSSLYYCCGADYEITFVAYF